MMASGRASIVTGLPASGRGKFHTRGKARTPSAVGENQAVIPRGVTPSRCPVNKRRGRAVGDGLPARIEAVRGVGCALKRIRTTVPDWATEQLPQLEAEHSNQEDAHYRYEQTAPLLLSGFDTHRIRIPSGRHRRFPGGMMWIYRVVGASARNHSTIFEQSCTLESTCRCAPCLAAQTQLFPPPTLRRWTVVYRRPAALKLLSPHSKLRPTAG